MSTCSDLRVVEGSPIESLFQSFILDRRASCCTPKTLEHYEYTVGSFVEYLKSQGLRRPTEIKPRDIRSYLVSLQELGRKDTTQHAYARGIKAWLNWMVSEGDLDESPMQKVKMPKLEKKVLPPFTSEEITQLLDHCSRYTPLGARNRAIILCLLNSGLRAHAFLSLKVRAVSGNNGMVTIMGKGQKQRVVRLGSKARSEVQHMLLFRPLATNDEALWITQYQKPLTQRGLQITLYRLGQKAGVLPCSAHRFRRTFVLWCLRSGMDLHSLSMLMGHADLSVLQRYLALASQDVERAHIAHSPVDNWIR